MADVRTLFVREDNEGRISLDDLAREGALRMIAAALEAEVEEYVRSFAEERDEDGKRLVVRNGKARERRLTVGSGTLPILRRGSTTNASTRSAESAGGSARGSCRRTRGGRRR